jgi:outer membrane protein, heavy metal efflux system
MTHRIRTVGAVLAAALVCAPRASAAEDPRLAALVEEALAGNPDLRALEEAVAAARARPAQAAALPDPTLSVGYTNEGWSPSLGSMPDSALSVMVAQDLPWPGKRALRRRLALLDADQAAQQLARARLGVEAAVRRAACALAQARLLLELSREQARLWGQIEGVARARYTVGQGAQQDVLRVQVEVTRVGQIDVEQRAEEAIRLAELNRLRGRADGAPIEIALDTAGPEAVGEEGLPAVLARLRAVSPELAFARSEIEAARLAVDLARKDGKPDLGVRAGYMNPGGRDPMWQAGVSITLPLARARRTAAVAEAAARLRAAEQRVQSVELQLRFRTEERLARLAAIERMTALYAEGVMPQDRLTVEAAMAGYQAGRIPFISVLESQATLYGDRGAYVRFLAARGQAKASLEEASLEATGDMPALPAVGMGGAPSMGSRPAGDPALRAGASAATGMGAAMKE